MFLFVGSHELCFAYGCFESSDTQISMTLDGEELFYADFKKGDLVWDSKVPTEIHVSEAYAYAEYYRITCKHDIYLWKPDKSAMMIKGNSD